MNGWGIRSTAPSGVINGMVQRFDIHQFNPVRPVRTSELPTLAKTLPTPPVGQIGETILPFTRTLAPLANQQSIVQVSTSGVMVLPGTSILFPGFPPSPGLPTPLTKRPESRRED